MRRRPTDTGHTLTILLLHQCDIKVISTQMNVPSKALSETLPGRLEKWYTRVREVLVSYKAGSLAKR